MELQTPGSTVQVVGEKSNCRGDGQVHAFTPDYADFHRLTVSITIAY